MGKIYFAYPRLRRKAYSSKTEGDPLLGSCLPSGSCTESVRADRKRKQKTESGSSHGPTGISIKLLPIAVYLIAQYSTRCISAPSILEKRHWGRAGLSQGEIFTSVGWILAIWSHLKLVGAGSSIMVLMGSCQWLPTSWKNSWQTQSRGNSPVCHGARRHLVNPHGDPRRNLQCKRQTDPQSPRMGPGPKGTATTISIPLLMERSAKHPPSLWQQPPCGDVAEPRNTGR